MKTTNALTALSATVLIMASTASNAALESRLSGLAYYDTDLDITWAADANINGQMDWDAANAWAGTLNIGGVGAGGAGSLWRLPDVDRDGNGVIVDCSIGAPATCVDNEDGNLYHSYGINAGATGVFSNIQGGSYWSGNQAPLAIQAWKFGFGTSGPASGLADDVNKTNLFYAMAVYDGDVAAVPIPAAVWLFGSGLLGLIGVARRRKQG